MCICVLCSMDGAPRGWKRILDSLELELQMIVSYEVDTEMELESSGRVAKCS